MSEHTNTAAQVSRSDAKFLRELAKAWHEIDAQLFAAKAKRARIDLEIRNLEDLQRTVSARITAWINDRLHAD